MVTGKGFALGIRQFHRITNPPLPAELNIISSEGRTAKRDRLEIWAVESCSSSPTRSKERAVCVALPKGSRMAAISSLIISGSKKTLAAGRLTPAN